MMLWNFLLAFYIVYADVIREDGYHNYEGQFTVENKGRMLRVLMSFRNVKPEECALHCVRHLRCRTYNYLHGKNYCELTDEDFDALDADTLTLGWHNYGTPKRVNGGWSSWRNYTDCSKTCGNGTRDQYRDCDSPTPAHGGAECKGKMTRRIKCNIRGCPVNGNWSNWKNSTDCTKPCGNGTMKQRRDCDSPKPAYGGANCTGNEERTLKCNTHECPVVNLALGKKATQSSTLHVDAGDAVDGDTSTRAITNYESTPWWEVDMGDVKEIKEMRLTAYEGSSSRNMGLMVETRTKEADSWKICNNFGDVENRVTNFQCLDKTTNARFVRIRSTKWCYLDLKEVEIFGY